MFFFDNVTFSVNGSGVLAEKGSLSAANSLSPVFGLGKRGVINQTPTQQIQNVFSADYDVEVDNEPNLGIISYIKSAVESFSYNAFQVCLGGISGNAYLDSYSFSLNENSSAKASVRFTSYEPTTGNFNPVTASLNPSNQSGIAHSWTTYLFSNGNQALSGKIYDFKYDFQARWRPQFVLGQKKPIQVNLESAEETFSFTSEFYKSVLFSGETAANFMSFDTIRTYGLQYLIKPNTSYLDFNFFGGRITQIEVNSNLNDMVRVTATVKKYY